MTFDQVMDTLREAVFKVAFETSKVRAGRMTFNNTYVHVLLTRENTNYNVIINANNDAPTQNYSYNFPPDYFHYYRNLIEFAYTIRILISEYVKSNADKLMRKE